MATPVQIADVLTEAGCETVMLGNDILVAPFCGRVLAVAPDGGDNAIWHNSAFDNGDTAKSLLADDGWQNHGGDRIWISPEMETHIPVANDFWGSYTVPKAFDPGNYKTVDISENSVTIDSTGTSRFFRSEREVTLQWTNTVRRIDAPLPLPDGVSFAGYETRTTLKSTDYAPAQPALWRLLQVIGGGRVVIPTQGERRLLPVFGEPQHETNDDGSLTCAVETEINYKLALHHLDSPGSLLYRRDDGATSDLIVRRFNIVNDAVYSDVPSSDAGKRGYIVQVYIDDGGYGGFGELEHHSPALDGGQNEVEDVTTTFVYRGSAEAIDALSGEIDY